MVAITRGQYGHLKNKVQGCDEQAFVIFDHVRISGYFPKLINEKEKEAKQDANRKNSRYITAGES